MQTGGSGAGPLQVALAFDAARALGEADLNAWRPRLSDGCRAVFGGASTRVAANHRARHHRQLGPEQYQSGHYSQYGYQNYQGYQYQGYQSYRGYQGYQGYQGAY